MADRPLGQIITVVNGEAIVRPHQSFIAKGAKVSTLDNKIIGVLDNPIGPVSHPYQVIRLNSDSQLASLVGQLVIAKVSSKKSSKSRKSKKSNRSNKR